MNTVERIALVVGQVLGVVAGVAGVLLLWGPGWALLVLGLVLVVGCTGMEAATLRRPGAPSPGRSGTNSAGGV